MSTSNLHQMTNLTCPNLSFCTPWFLKRNKLWMLQLQGFVNGEIQWSLVGSFRTWVCWPLIHGEVVCDAWQQWSPTASWHHRCLTVAFCLFFMYFFIYFILFLHLMSRTEHYRNENNLHSSGTWIQSEFEYCIITKTFVQNIFYIQQLYNSASGERTKEEKKKRKT